MGNRNQLRARANPLGGIQAQDIMNQMIGDAATEPEIIEREVVVYQSDPNALIPQGDGVYVYKRFVMTPTGMQMPEDVTADEWREVGGVIRGLETSIQWIVGDWFAAGEGVWGESYGAVAADLGYEVETLYTYASACRSVETSIRNRGLSMAHHRLIVSMNESPELQWYWLEYAATRKPKRLSVGQMKAEIRALQLASVERQIAELRTALSQPEMLVSQLPDFKPPTLPPKTAGREEKQAEKYTQYVQNELPNLEQMDVQRRAAVAERAEWLAQYYEGVARRARGA